MNTPKMPGFDVPTPRAVAPQAREAERSVLGCILLEKDSIIKIADILVATDFYHNHHQFIYQSALELFQRSEPVDLVTIATSLQANGKLELIGGPAFLAELQNEVPTASHIFQYGLAPLYFPVTSQHG